MLGRASPSPGSYVCMVQDHGEMSLSGHDPSHAADLLSCHLGQVNASPRRP